MLATPSPVSGVVSSSKGLTRPSISKKKTELFRENLKMSYMKTQMKSDLWDIVYKAQADGVGREVTNAIIDVMILMDKEAENSEKTEDCS